MTSAPTLDEAAQHILRRETFQTSRLLDFCSECQLVKQIGHGCLTCHHRWSPDDRIDFVIPQVITKYRWWALADVQELERVASKHGEACQL